MKNCHSFEHVADTMPVTPRNSEMLSLEFFGNPEENVCSSGQ